jgi:phage portal protein BeeE
LETEQQMTPDQAQVLRDTWTDMHYKTRKPAVLSGGLKWKPINASASDMDTMQHRESLVRDIARAYRIPLHLMLGTGGDSQTYQNIESAPGTARTRDCEENIESTVESIDGPAVFL